MFDTKRSLRYHFVGIGGIGMSALAQIIKSLGHFVGGSDRRNDKKQTPEVFHKLVSQGIKLSPQDGTGVSKETDFVVISSAVEEDNSDLRVATQQNIQTIKRSDLLGSLFNNKHGIAIGGSNGKTTVCGMTSWILDEAGRDPTVVGGGYVKNFITDTSLGNSRFGRSETVVIEADESDGSLIKYMPKVSVITNISKDHKTVEELGELFSKFAENTSDTVIINENCSPFMKINNSSAKIITFGEGSSSDVCASQVSCNPFGSRFKIKDNDFEINVPGLYNVYNALAAIAVAETEGVSNLETKKALKTFKGTKRRMEVIGEANGIKVIDDYAHNPRKIQAAIDTVRLISERLIVVFQPHGYGPTEFLREELVSAFAEKILPSDTLLMPEIFYAGGTASKRISSKDIIKELKDGGVNAFFVPDRDGIVAEVKQRAVPHDSVLVMGARDDSLTDLCRAILNEL
ncbi:MAG: UDP-N-acetylmuramate--L-alanine ligase [Candidatus Scalindua sp.]|jgi:UDP-N-acetylmuramate--alanine ligase|nr:UDP-N-acetylmuramate--L-alanine ligase [Candidatus Scalindua sp.]MBT5304123.1 UDP-N-acetylmuramate--L-alanine ligase [Candidatus Scalindua sp.]MBT6229573.1 UDP-N-acetylmuramate--L-alanine ligase [Candidatus Scalindua sp.]MBT6562352.1 UDP-N-acetylmuramate--L-alanine ligase [Candidatus Scalindua sp.]MBT7211356.1 UDP-N-acetylmuramate--L-alanine ligase [Candidatus Scalindua sp.]